MPDPIAPAAPPSPAPKPGAAASPGAAQTPPSPPGDASAKPGETPAPAPAKAKDHAAVARAAHALREEKRALKEREASWVKEREELSGKLTAAQELAKELDVLKSERAEFLKDPIVWAEKHGGTGSAEAIQAYINRTTPEKNVEAARAEALEAKKAAEELKALLAKRDEKEAADKKAAEAAQHEANRQAVCSRFASTVLADAKTFPHINFMYEKDEFLAKVVAFQKAAEEAGETHSAKEVADAFEADAKKRYELNKQREARLEEFLAASVAGSEPGSAPGIQAKPVPGSGRREDSTRPETRTASKPKPQRVLTRREQRDADIALLRAAQHRDAAANKTH